MRLVARSFSATYRRRVSSGMLLYEKKNTVNTMNKMHEPNQMDTLPYASSGIALPENCFMLTQWFLTGGSQQISGVVRSLTHPTTRKV